MLLQRIDRAFAEAGPDLTPVLEAVATETGVALADACGILLLGSDDLLRSAALYHPDPALKLGLIELFSAPPLRLGEGLLGAVAQGLETFLIPEAEPGVIASLVREASRAGVMKYAPRSLLATPLRARGRVVGLLFLARTRPGHPFTDGDRLVVEDIAGLSALVIDAARIHEREVEARRRAGRMAENARAMQSLTVRLSRAVTAVDVARALLESAFASSNARSGLVAVRAPDEAGLRVLASRGADETVAELRRVARRFVSAEGLGAGEDVASEDEALPVPHGVSVTVPLRTTLGAEGALSLAFAALHEIDGDLRTLLETMGGHAAQALERTRAFEAERAAREKAETTGERVALLLDKSAALHKAEQDARARAEAAERRLKILAAASMRLAESLDLRTTLDATARAALPGFAQLATVELDEWEHEPSQFASAAENAALEAELEAIHAQEPVGSAHPRRRALAEGRPFSFAPEAEEWTRARPRNGAFLARLGIKAGLVLPIVARGRTMGVLTFGRRAPFDADDLVLAEELARHAGLAIDNARLLESTRRSDDDSRHAMNRLAVLAQAGQVFSASLEPHEVGESIASLVVPSLASYAVVDLMGSNGELQRVGLAYAEPSWADDLRGLPPPNTLPQQHPIHVAARLSQTVVIPRPAERLAERSLNEEHRARQERIGARSGMVVPLIARGRAIGTLSLGSAHHDYDANDLEIVRQIADRAALALDNARLYAESQAAISLRDDFLSVAGHELRTPLTTIMLSVGSMQRALRRGGLTDGFEAKTEVLESQLWRLDRLVTELLDVSRITAGKLTLNPEPLDLAQAARDVLTRFQEAAAEAGCVLSLTAPTPVRGTWDRMRIDQALTNLLENALKYAAGRPVHVTIQAAERRARVTVRDGGRGIAPADQARIFERFERAVRSTEYAGLGLGLWIVRRIVESHGGTIHVESRLGEGAAFTLELPFETPPAQAGT